MSTLCDSQDYIQERYGHLYPATPFVLPNLHRRHQEGQLEIGQNLQAIDDNYYKFNRLGSVLREINVLALKTGKR
jgi:hypothetical protein